jgi:hypothetical protein
VRLAVGACRGRLVRQLLIENLMVAIAGGAAGLMLARWTAGMLTLFVPPTPYPIRVRRVAEPASSSASPSALTALTAVVSGLLPALRGSRSDVAVALKASAPASIGGGPRAAAPVRWSSPQVALSLLLLVCAALFLRSLTHAQTMDTGYSARRGSSAQSTCWPAATTSRARARRVLSAGAGAV